MIENLTDKARADSTRLVDEAFAAAQAGWPADYIATARELARLTDEDIAYREAELRRKLEEISRDFEDQE